MWHTVNFPPEDEGHRRCTTRNPKKELFFSVQKSGSIRDADARRPRLSSTSATRVKTRAVARKPDGALPLASGRPSLRFLQGWAAMLPTQLLSVLHRRCVCRRRTRPFRLREGRGTRVCGGFCSLKAGPPAPPTLRFPERTRVALRSDLAHDNHQNCNFIISPALAL